MWRLCCPYLFLTSPSFGASGGLCFMIVAVPEYLHWHFPGPSCSKLMISLVNVSLKLWSLNMANVNIFAEKCEKLLHLQKLLTFFFSKNTCELDIVLARTVNILTTNELVQLRTLWRIGPCLLSCSHRTLKRSPLRKAFAPNRKFEVRSRKWKEGINHFLLTSDFLYTFSDFLLPLLISHFLLLLPTSCLHFTLYIYSGNLWMGSHH